MDWFGEEDDIHLAVAGARVLAADAPLPVTAVSRSRDAVLSRHHRLLGIGGALFVAGILFMLVVALQQRAETRRDMLVFILVFTVIMSGTCYVLAQRRLRAPRAYRDPGLTIEVRPDGIAFGAPAGSHAIGWEEIEAQVTTVNFRGKTYFEGLRLESPFGTQKLNDEYYANGRIAAAAIVRGMDEARLARERGKVERLC